MGFDVPSSSIAKHSLSSHSTPRTIPHSPNPDVLRIYVPYSSPLDTPVASPQNGGICLPLTPFSENNKVRIRIDNDELPTPLIEHGQITSYRIGSPEIDLK